jgi:hypothetical protein
MTYVLPQVQVFQEFELAPAALVQPLLACNVGPNFDLHRYDDPDEKALIKVTDSYDPDSEECFAWPGRQDAAVVDESYTRVFIDDALLQYFFDPSGDASEIRAVAGSRNKIRFESHVLATANGVDRSAAFNGRDVTPGDTVDLLASACGSPVSLRTSVLALEADIVAAVVKAATADEDNQPSLVASVGEAQTGGPDNQVEISLVDGTTYDGLDDGQPAETYDVEVVGGSSDEDATSAILKVTSLSGTDDEAAVTPVAFGSPTPIGSRGLEVTWVNTGSSPSSLEPGVDVNDFQIGQKWRVTVQQDYTAPVPTSGGVYNGAKDTTYIATVTKGGAFVDEPQITVSTTTGIDFSGPTVVPGSAVAVPIGSQGATLALTAPEGLNEGDRFLVPVTSASQGAIKTIVLANPLPDELRGLCTPADSSSSPAPEGADLTTTLYIRKDIEVPENRVGAAPLVNWEQRDTEVCLQPGICAFDASWNGGNTALKVKDGEVFVHHRDFLNAHCHSVGTIADVSDIPNQLGTIDPDNPLAFAQFKTMSNAAGVDTKFIAVCPDSPLDLEDWLEALEFLKGRSDTYSLVPLTQDKEVLDAFQAHIEDQSTAENGRWRIGWFNLAAEEEIGVVTESQATLADEGDPILATITDDPDTSGTQNTLVVATDEKFIQSGVRGGDILRANFTTDGFGNTTFDEFVIDAVLNEEELRLVSGPAAAVNVASKVEVYRNLNRTELAEDLARKPGLFFSRRINLVWPDTVGNAGETFPGYFMCAALAGLRSSVLPHQGLTNVEIFGFDDVTRSTEFLSQSQLNTMADSGYWIVTQDEKTGLIHTRHQLTTGDQADINQKEQSITTNLDSISFAVLERLAPLIGKGNVTNTMISILKGEFISVAEFFVNTILLSRLGPQIEAYEILEFGRHPTLKDRIVIRARLFLPAPLNVAEVHLVVAGTVLGTTTTAAAA